MSNYAIRIIAIPAGKCPIKLISSDYEEVIEWTKEVHSFGVSNNLNYLPSAFVFFARQFFNIFSQEYKDVCNHINSAYNVDNAQFTELLNKVGVEEKQNKIEKKKKREEADRLEADRLEAEKIEKRKQIKKVEIKIEPKIEEEKPKKKIILRRK
jgi:hypothetical protein